MYVDERNLGWRCSIDGGLRSKQMSVENWTDANARSGDGSESEVNRNQSASARRLPAREELPCNPRSTGVPPSDVAQFCRKGHELFISFS